MRQTILLPQTFLPLQSIQLGRLVLDVQQPHSDFLDPFPVEPQDILVKPADQFRGEESKATTKDFGSALCHLLSLSRSKRKGVTTRITTARVTTYLLNNSGKWFHQAVQSEDARKWIENANRRGEDIYLVSGYYTVLDAHVYESGAHRDATEGNVAFPVTKVLTATSSLVPSADPSMTAGQKQQHAGMQSFLAPGEQVSAVQYRKVQFKWYSSRELHDKPLGPNKWKTYWTLRGQTEDVVEVDLEDDLELEDADTVYVYDEDNFSISTVEQDLGSGSGTLGGDEPKAAQGS